MLNQFCCLMTVGITLLLPAAARAQSPATAADDAVRPLTLSLLTQQEQKEEVAATEEIVTGELLDWEELQDIQAFVWLEDPQPLPTGAWRVEIEASWATRSGGPPGKRRIGLAPVPIPGPPTLMPSAPLPLRLPLVPGARPLPLLPIFWGPNQQPFTFLPGPVGFLPAPPGLALLPFPRKRERHRMDDSTDLTVKLSHRPRGPEWLRNMELQLSLPLELGDGDVEGNGDLEFGILYRFIREDGWVPTVALLSTMRIPSGYRSGGVDGTFTGIVSHTLGPGVLYLNGTVATLNNNIEAYERHFQWSIVPGYKLPVADGFALIFDYVNQSSPWKGVGNQNLLEMAAEINLADGLTLGPGVQIGLDGRDGTQNLGAGVVLEYEF
jgi:hypothetical protein